MKFLRQNGLLIVLVLTLLFIFLFAGSSSIAKTGFSNEVLYNRLIPFLSSISVIMIIWGGGDYFFTTFFAEEREWQYKNYLTAGFVILGITLYVGAVLWFRMNSLCCGPTPDDFNPQDFEQSVTP